MKAHTHKVSKNKEEVISSSYMKKQDNKAATSQFKDMRASSQDQQMLQRMADHSVRVHQAKAIQAMAIGSLIQNKMMPQAPSQSVHKKENKTGLPNHLKTGIENISGYTMDDVKVHYNSSKPAQLQAHAYAQGTEIHIGPGKEKYLAHEAWHVVQQKQGRVQPTLQMKLFKINDDAHLENEADVMGRKALLHSNTEVKQLKPSRFTSVVQRAAGFEFETGWLVEDQTDVEIWRKSGSKGIPPKSKPLKKKDVVHPGSGFNVEADEAGGGHAELEFVIHPPIPTTDYGIASALGRMVPVYLFGAKLLSKSGSKAFPLNQATGNNADKKFIIYPNDHVLSARPQVTSGISLEHIPKLQFAHEGVSLPEQLNQTHQSAKYAVSFADEALKLLPPNLNAFREPLRGLLMPIGMYLNNGSRGIFYPKQIADDFLLARTDFVGLFKLLPEALILHFKENPKLFVKMAMVAGDVEALEDPVIGKVWINEKDLSEGSRAVGPTRDKWLHFIVLGYDLLSGLHYKDFETSDPQHHEVSKDLESLGELGKKTEPVLGHGSQTGGIFELRSAALKPHQSGLVPMLQWLPFIQQTLTYFRNLGRS